ncbi:hypothetical protein KC19_5G047300 [Ceratodon purpureus]|uniref:Uncharacterized protein n=1 Tax=Ceratodon purpureus TaxID=3225 RepID=A0A8T0I0C8_CERPU|nr:hypothetical protein KC19_5G047300 [Ceratodon purpureus]
MFHNGLLLLNIVVCILVFFRLCRMVADENKAPVDGLRLRLKV